MKSAIKYILLFYILTFTFMPAIAKDSKQIASVQEQTEEEGMPKGISFVTKTELHLIQGLATVPANSTVYAIIVDSEGERRWHKSGFIICKIKGYEKNNEYYDVERKNIYMIGRKYQPIDKKEMGKTVAELAATTTAAVFVPGVDIAYFFTKGMIKKKEGCTRFKSGVSTAYENSIFWFWLKGKPVDLEDNAVLSFKEITKEDAEKLQKKITKREKKISKNE